VAAVPPNEGDASVWCQLVLPRGAFFYRVR
jgi:hypothetical protein